MRKASNFANFAKEHGWQSKCTQEGIVVRLFARRGENETLEIQWHDGCVLTEFAPVYSLAGERIKVRNLSAASKVIQEKPDPKRLAKATRKRKRQTGIDYSGGPLSDDDRMSLRGSVPFDAESTDDEIEAVLHKRSITWINTISGQVDSARIDADKQFKIVRKNGNEKIKADFVTFCCAEGYRAVYLKSIVAVS